MACSAHTARCRNARSYDELLAPCCRRHVIQIMGDVADQLNRNGVVWWADYGTLLGAVRNPLTTWEDYPWLNVDRDGGPPPGIVPHDKDADIGVLWADWQRCRQIRVEFMAAGYNVRLNASSGSIKVRLSGKNHTNVDIFFWRDTPPLARLRTLSPPPLDGPDDSYLYRLRYPEVDNFKGKEFPRSWLRDLTTVEWEGLTLPAPREPERFLAYRYGPNWRTPIAANNDGVPR